MSCAKEELSKPKRFNEFPGKAKFIFHPIKSILLLLAIFIVSAPFANQPVGILFAAISTYFLLMAVRLEGSWMDITPLSPLVVVCLGSWFRCGLGGILLSLGEPSNRTDPIWAQLPQAQLLWLIFTAAIITTFSIIRPKKPSKTAITSGAADSKLVARITLACGFFAIASIAIGLSAGTLDRNPESYMYWIHKRWQPDSILIIFSRFKDAFFFLFPMAMLGAKSRGIKIILTAFFIGYIIMALPLGGRGLILYPMMYASLGLLMTRARTSTIILYLLGTLLFSVLMVPTIAIYRSQASFGAITRNDYFARVLVLREAVKTSVQQFDASSLMWSTGRSMYACSDGYLFKSPSLSKPRAGSHRMEAFTTAWIPSLIMPRRIPIRDSHIIAQEARGTDRSTAESMTYTSFPCISFGGDLFWRGGWSWVMMGSILAAIGYRVASFIWYRYANWRSLGSILLLILPATFLQAYPFSSIGETAWIWMWDLPKYIILICLTQLLRRKFKGAQTQ